MTAAEGPGPLGLARRLLAWTQRRAVARRLAFALALLALLSGIATYVVLTHSAPFGPDPNSILILVNVNLAFFLVLVAFVARRVVQLWADRRRGSAGSRLHVPGRTRDKKALLGSNLTTRRVSRNAERNLIPLLPSGLTVASVPDRAGAPLARRQDRQPGPDFDQALADQEKLF